MTPSPESIGPNEADSFVRRVHEEHGSALYAWARKRFADPRDAEEVVAESLVKAWKAHDQFDSKRGSERSWLFGILRNTASDHYRGRARHLRLISTEEVPERPTDSGIDLIAESTVVREAILSLSEHHREAIAQAFFAGRTVSQIAESLGIPSGTVKSRLYYGMRSLRTALEERGVLHE